MQYATALYRLAGDVPLPLPPDDERAALALRETLRTVSVGSLTESAREVAADKILIIIQHMPLPYLAVWAGSLMERFGLQRGDAFGLLSRNSDVAARLSEIERRSMLEQLFSKGRLQLFESVLTSTDQAGRDEAAESKRRDDRGFA